MIKTGLMIALICKNYIICGLYSCQDTVLVITFHSRCTTTYVSKTTFVVDVCHSGLSGIGCLSCLKYRFPTCLPDRQACLPAGRRASLAGMTKNETLDVMFLVSHCGPGYHQFARRDCFTPFAMTSSFSICNRIVTLARQPYITGRVIC